MVQRITTPQIKQVSQDITLAKRYCAKVESCVARKIEFRLSLADFKRLTNRKTCYFTGVTLTRKNFTLDRVNNEKGYTKDNTVPCSQDFNTFKSSIESTASSLDLDLLNKAVKNWMKHRKTYEQ
jgi:hypothetical protein